MYESPFHLASLSSAFNIFSSYFTRFSYSWSRSFSLGVSFLRREFLYSSYCFMSLFNCINSLSKVSSAAGPYSNVGLIFLKWPRVLFSLSETYVISRLNLLICYSWINIFYSRSEISSWVCLSLNLISLMSSSTSLVQTTNNS